MDAHEVQRRAREWVARDPDPETRGELERLLEAGDAAALAALFGQRIAFGTAGLRAAMGPGPARMNRLVVRQSAAGIARYLISIDPEGSERGVVVGHDARRRSAAFAADVAEVIAAHGIPVSAASGPLPTPVVVHAVAAGGAAAGVVITASHNPAEDNGLKLYLDDAAQIVPPHDERIAAAIDAVATDGKVEPSDRATATITPLDPELIASYRDAIRARVPDRQGQIGIALTAMHGVGGDLLMQVLQAAGFEHLHTVEDQHQPDPDFPTVAFPNPEEPCATDRLTDAMVVHGAEIGLALDPDADRVAVLVARSDDRPRQLTGDEVGCVLAQWLLEEVTTSGPRLVVNTVVSSQLLGAIAADHGVEYAETLTGFKWLCRPALENPGLRQVLAYEEALGYAVGGVRDKDGIGAALALAVMASRLAAVGRTILDLLDDLHIRHGVHMTENFSLRDEAPGGAERQATTVSRLAESAPGEIAGRAVHGVEWAGPGVLRLRLDGGLRVLLRPSGTEPKLKCYCEIVRPVADRVDLPAARVAARAELHALRGDLATLIA